MPTAQGRASEHVFSVTCCLCDGGCARTGVVTQEDLRVAPKALNPDPEKKTDGYDSKKKQKTETLNHLLNGS